MKKAYYILGSFLMVSLLQGCDMFGGPSSDIPDAELRKKWRECQTIKNMSRTKALACDNYERQCAKRKDDGNFVCY